MLYMVTFTINIPQMSAYIPYMDPMGYIYTIPMIYKPTFTSLGGTRSLGLGRGIRISQIRRWWSLRAFLGLFQIRRPEEETLGDPENPKGKWKMYHWLIYS